jgi:hypothetical protein
MTRLLDYLRRNAIALAALFIALAGTSYAAIAIPANSVGTKQLRKHAVTNNKIAKHAVSASNLDPRSIAGHVVMWAKVSASGQVSSSSPSAMVSTGDPSRGFYVVSWHRGIPASRCIAIAGPVDDPVIAGAVTANTFGLSSSNGSTSVTLQTFDSHGANAPESASVIVLCG